MFKIYLKKTKEKPIAIVIIYITIVIIYHSYNIYKYILLFCKF